MKKINRFMMAILVIIGLSAAVPAFAWNPQDCVDYDRTHGMGSAHQQDRICPDTTPSTQQPVPSESNAAAAATAAQQQAALAAARAELNSLQTQMTSLESNPTLTAEQRNQQRTELQSRIASANENINQITNNVRATGGAGGVSQASANGAAGNMTTTAIGGTVYQAVKQPVAGAFVGLPAQIMAQGTMVMTTTACGGDFRIEEDYGIVATHSTFLGIATTTRDNGKVMKVVSNGSSVSFGSWEAVGYDGQEVLLSRKVTGYQAVITSYIVGSSAGSGVAVNAQNAAVGLSNQGGVQTFGNNIQKFPCGYTETQAFRAFPVIAKSEPAKMEVILQASANAGAEAEEYIPSNGPIVPCTGPVCACGKTKQGRTVTAPNKPGECQKALRAAGVGGAAATAQVFRDGIPVTGGSVSATAGETKSVTIPVPTK